MNILSTILGRLFNRVDADDLARLPASYRNVGGGSLMGRIASVGLLRLALRWPAASIILMLLVLVARAMTGRRQHPNEAIRTP